MRKRIVLTAIAAAFCTGAYLQRERIILTWIEYGTSPVALGEQLALLAPAAETYVPDEGDGPFPVVLQFHGCAGPRKDFLREWARIANEAGYAAMIIDSTGPRGFDRLKALDTICKGRALLGIERTRDVVAAIRMAQQDNRLDADRIILAGWSHGGWTVMDFLTMDMASRRPPGLDLEDYVQPKINGVILFYPHCGAGALSRLREWRQAPDIISFIGAKDTVVNADECIALLSERKAGGAPVDLVIYPDADHIFDDVFLQTDYPQFYDAHAAADAVKRYRNFLLARKSAE